jgi:hypothetical protein
VVTSHVTSLIPITRVDMVNKSKSQCDWRRVSLSCCRAPSGTLTRYLFLFTVLAMWGALSVQRSVLSLVNR